MEAACLVGCSVMTGYGAVVNTAQMEPGSSVAVIGLGGIGLNIAQSAALAGASRSSRSTSRSTNWRRRGSSERPTPWMRPVADAVDAVKKMTRATTGGGVDYAFEAIGLAATAEQAFAMARRGGTAVIVGMVAMGEKIQPPGIPVPE